MIPVLISHGIHQQINPSVYYSIKRQGICNLFTAIFGDGSNRPLYEVEARNMLKLINANIKSEFIVMQDHCCFHLYDNNFTEMESFLNINKNYGGVLLHWLDKNNRVPSTLHKRIGCGMYRSDFFSKIDFKFDNMCVCNSVIESGNACGMKVDYINDGIGRYIDFIER